MLHGRDITEPEFVMDVGVLENSLQALPELLHKHHGQKAILLIDEYDAPLDKAQQFGYYGGMASLEAGCLEALRQIDEKGCAKQLLEDGMETIFKYGIACRKKGYRALAGKAMR